MNMEPQSLHHNLITLPTGKRADDVVTERHDIVLLFDATKANPNGDPDTGNMPRLQPDSLKGLVTDVCLKRKIRNFYSLYHPNATLRNGSPSPGNEIFIRENAILQEVMESPEIESLARRIFATELNQKPAAWDAKKKKKGKAKAEASSAPATADALPVDQEVSPADEFKKRAYRDALCRTFLDLRAFGGVTSTEGPLKGSFWGQIRGPLQFAFAESLDRILQLDATITRCAVASAKELKETESAESEETGNRTMGRKHVVDYALYRTHIYFSPAFAAKTGFTYYDLDNFFFALVYMFRDDTAAGRAGMRVVGLVDFEHASALGNEHAHKLFDLVKVQRTAESRQRNADFPNSLDDYSGFAPAGNVREDKENGQSRPLVVARKLVWDIPADRLDEPNP
jgi:CRISPR-associated protein Csd2